MAELGSAEGRLIPTAYSATQGSSLSQLTSTAIEDALWGWTTEGDRSDSQQLFLVANFNQPIFTMQAEWHLEGGSWGDG